MIRERGAQPWVKRLMVGWPERKDEFSRLSRCAARFFSTHVGKVTPDALLNWS